TLFRNPCASPGSASHWRVRGPRRPSGVLTMNEESLFIEALETRDAAARAALLDRACAGDAALRGRLERLLDQHARAGSFPSRQVIARFEAERQALAMMDHVNIARVLDAGTTESGRPYFVMELVHGVPITKYCDDNRLTPRERLELFVPVCQAIQHAHQKGIIHRDIKPSNVMITLYDGKPVPKVIDFGVAKATEQKLTE